MGHAEMLLAVAGLDQLQVKQHVKVLASGDWSLFPPHERVLLNFARQLSKKPETIGPAEVDLVVRHLGTDRTLDWMFHICWCNFMTRVADAFQVPLESVNVFLPPERPQ
jgi:hypothetical protein